MEVVFRGQERWCNLPDCKASPLMTLQSGRLHHTASS
jgi:hypothetical protein